jgi:hypothetical protein
MAGWRIAGLASTDKAFVEAYDLIGGKELPPCLFHDLPNNSIYATSFTRDRMTNPAGNPSLTQAVYAGTVLDERVKHETQSH